MADRFTLGDARQIPTASAGAALCYCFDLQPCGYIVVSGALSLPPVIAYSFTSEAGSDLGPANPLADLLEWDLRLRLDSVDRLPAAVAAQQRAAWAEYLGAAPAAARGRFEQWPPAGSTPTGGWLLTNWTQSSPYNTLCPMDFVHGQRSLAGCPAVAMAQIVNYQARLNGTHFADADDYYHNYAGNQFWIDNDYVARSFPSWPQLNTYLTTVLDNYFHGTPLSNTSKAALVFACGVAAHQVYNSTGSGTFGVSQAFQAFQKFGCSEAELLDANSPNLHARIAQNMMNAIPAHLAVVNSGWTVGHNLVLDGYNTDDYFHLNFGWGGSYNGWYQLLVGLPYSLTVIEGVIVDINLTPCAPMDGTCDGAVAWDDYVYFAGCLSGPATGYGAPGCRAFDGDSDSDVDLPDFATFQAAFGQAPAL